MILNQLKAIVAKADVLSVPGTADVKLKLLSGDLVDLALVFEVRGANETVTVDAQSGDMAEQVTEAAALVLKQN